MKFSRTAFQKKIIKPWGEEVIFTPPSLKRAGKIIKVKSGQRLSLQYHDQKEETLCLISGKAALWLADGRGKLRQINMKPFYGYTILPKQRHRLQAFKDSILAEVSSIETGTTFRIEDDYGRTDETQAIRKRPNRGWKK